MAGALREQWARNKERSRALSLLEVPIKCVVFGPAAGRPSTRFFPTASPVTNVERMFSSGGRVCWSVCGAALAADVARQHQHVWRKGITVSVRRMGIF